MGGKHNQPVNRTRQHTNPLSNGARALRAGRVALVRAWRCTGSTSALAVNGKLAGEAWCFNGNYRHPPEAFRKIAPKGPSHVLEMRSDRSSSHRTFSGNDLVCFRRVARPGTAD